MTRAMERRGAIRYPLQVPASFSWEDEERNVRQGEGCTRDISEKGVFVDAALCPPIGSSVEIRFSLPALSDSSRRMDVQHTGETLRLERTEQGGPGCGFAIRSREVVWHYENGESFSNGDKEQN
jgi:hypothetical protein